MQLIALAALLGLGISIANVAPAEAGPAKSGPDRVSILMGSKHVGAKRDFNERNPGLFLTWEDRGGLDYSLGIYHNSFSNTSVAALAAKPVYVKDDLHVSLFGGVAHYPGDTQKLRNHIGNVIPLGGVQVRYKNMFVQAMPTKTMTIFAAGVTMPLGD